MWNPIGICPVWFCGRLSVKLRDRESRQICFNCSARPTINSSSAVPATTDNDRPWRNWNRHQRQDNNHGICVLWQPTDCWLRLTQIQQPGILLCPPMSIIPDWNPTFNHSQLLTFLEEKKRVLSWRKHHCIFNDFYVWVHINTNEGPCCLFAEQELNIVNVPEASLQNVLLPSITCVFSFISTP